jgi:multidrug efflux pump subunit AcrB
MNILKKVVHYKRVVIFTAIAFILLGIGAYLLSVKQEFPQINAPAATISVIYPGASPSQVERDVTKIVENEAVKLSGYDYSHSISLESYSNLIMRFDVNTDMEKTKNELNALIVKLEDKLPQAVTKIELNTDLVETVSAYIVIESDDFDIKLMNEYANKLSYRLLEVDGITQVKNMGDNLPLVDISLDISLMEKYSLDFITVSNVVQSYISDIPLGSYFADDYNINFKLKNEETSLNGLKDLVIVKSPVSESTITLKDLGEVSLKYDKSDEIIRFNGKQVVLLNIFMSSDKNIINIGEDIKNILKDYSKELPKGTSISIPFFASEIVSESVSNFNTNLYQGMALVFVVILLGMSFRNSLVVATALPLSIFITFLIMYVFKIELNQISIASLIISLGMVVDNAIVVSDSIQVDIDQYGKTENNIMNSVSKVAIPVLTSTLTTIFAFSPLLLLGGVAGEYVSSLPMIIIISLTASYIISIFYTPVFSFLLLKESKKKERKYFLRGVFTKTLRFMLKKSYLLLPLIVLLIFLAYFMYKNTVLQFFPYADDPMLYINYEHFDSNDTKTTEELTINIEKTINDFDKNAVLLSSSGASLPKFFNTMIPGSSTVNGGMFYLKFDLDYVINEYGSIENYVSTLQDKLSELNYQGSVDVKRLELGEPIGSPIRLILSNLELDSLYDESEEIINTLNNIQGISKVYDDKPKKVLYYELEIDDKKLAYYNINKQELLANVSLAIGNSSLPDTNVDGDLRSINFSADLNKYSQLLNIKIFDISKQKQFKLSDVAKVTQTFTLPNINKYDRKYSVTINADILPGYSPQQVEKKIKEELLKTEYRTDILFDGEMNKIIQYFGDIGILALIAVVLVFVTLLIQFNSIKKVMIILFTIPLSVFGSITGLYLMNLKLSFTSLLGIVSLMGIVVNNAIILIDYIDKEIENEIYDLDFALENAVQKRFRPIMLTTITTVFGLLPLVIKPSPLFTPMSVTLLSGLLFSTLLTLIYIPVLYKVFFSKKIQSLRDKRINKLLER